MKITTLQPPDPGRRPDGPGAPAVSAAARPRASVQTARSRSMESATGLLYINVGSIAAGTILAAGLYFGAGVLV